MTGRRTVRTTCPYCGVGCGVVARPGGIIEGDRAHPSNRGRLCVKGASLGATLDDRDRLRRPFVHGKETTWDAALDLVAQRLGETIAAHGPDSVAFYVSGQFLTEDYYVANKLMKGFIGSGNIDTNSRLCMASSVAGHVRAFGEDVVPGVYEDWDEADLVVLVGNNAAWCHPVLYQRLLAARKRRGTRIVVVDPRRTPTAETADLHLPVAPEADVALFNGLLAYLAVHGAVDRAWTARHTEGLEEALAAAFADQRETGIDPALTARFHDWFARTERVLTVYSQGVNQSRQGTDKVNAIINCHLATGRIGRPGMGPFSVTGQPNAMGGREVGGLANQLAAHMRFDRPADVDALARFWNAPSLARKPGLKAIEMFDAVRDGRIRAIWIAATNPAASMPRADHVRAALAACPFVVAADCWPNDTTARAHVVLPAAGWGEKDGTVTSSERRISRQRAFRAPPGEARADWWMFAELGRRLGWADAFAWNGPADIFREHAALSGFENDGARRFDISALAEADYDALAPLRWPMPARANRGAAREGARLFAEGGFPTGTGRARIVAVTSAPAPAGTDFVLNTGRVRDQWHTMTRTGRVAALMAHTPEPMLAIHPADAAAAGLGQGDYARIETGEGAAVLRADLRPGQRRGELFAPMHWTDAFASAGPIGRLVAAALDPHSGQPGLKSTPARVRAAPMRFHGLLLRRAAGPAPADCHWTRIPHEAGEAFRLAGPGAPPAPEDLLGAAPSIALADPRRGVLRAAVLADGVLEAALFLAPAADALPTLGDLAPLLGRPVPDAERTCLLAGRGSAGTGTFAAHICTCFGVSRDAIREAVITHRLESAREIGARLRAGTNCGSCFPELEEILRDVRALAD